MNCEKIKEVLEKMSEELKTPFNIEIAPDVPGREQEAVYIDDTLRIVEDTFEVPVDAGEIAGIITPSGVPLKEVQGLSIQSLAKDELNNSIIVEIMVADNIYDACKAVATMIFTTRLNPIVEMYKVKSGIIKADS
jgi:hypothetical protein